MAEEVTVEAGDLEGFAEALLTASEELADEISGANLIILEAMRVAVAELYPNMEEYWEYEEQSPEAGEIAHLTATSSDKDVLWYEYGSQSHPIDPVNVSILKFYWARFDETVFLPHVDHPGARAHNNSEDLASQVGTEAVVAWGDAVVDALSSV